MLARSSVPLGLRWVCSVNLRPPSIDCEYVDANRFRRETQVSAGSRASNGGAKHHCMELPDGTLVFTFGDTSSTPPSRSKKKLDAAPEPAAHTEAEETADWSTAPSVNGAGKRRGHAIHPTHEEEKTGDEGADRVGGSSLGGPGSDSANEISLKQCTVKELKQMCKDMGLKGYSADKKPVLIARLEETYASDSAHDIARSKRKEPAGQHSMEPSAAAETEEEGDIDSSSDLDTDFDLENADLATLTVKQLKQAAKHKGLKGYSGLRKQALVGLLLGQ